ncbi:flagellar biosynthetic protein FliO [Sphingomonas arenae]|uniref:flagellar biosynthetic protein FliO n=1 Tax=Sphingomonas arenae TaxID=2812555 RepID=UPI001967025B|nr:flagellar biosynthetic protein FliO [Sphingomonas arenae]
MDALSLLRTLGSLAVVLGVLVGGLWFARRFNLGPGMTGSGTGPRRVEVVERTPIDSRRSVLLIRRDGREHLLVIGPEGTAVVESAIVRDACDRQAEEARKSEIEAQRAMAAKRIEQAQARTAAAMNGARTLVQAAWRSLRVTGKRCARLLRHQIRRRRLMLSNESFGMALARISAVSADQKESHM